MQKAVPVCSFKSLQWAREHNVLFLGTKKKKKKKSTPEAYFPLVGGKIMRPSVVATNEIIALPATDVGVNHSPWRFLFFFFKTRCRAFGPSTCTGLTMTLVQVFRGTTSSSRVGMGVGVFGDGGPTVVQTQARILSDTLFRCYRQRCVPPFNLKYGVTLLQQPLNKNAGNLPNAVTIRKRKKKCKNKQGKSWGCGNMAT